MGLGELTRVLLLVKLIKFYKIKFLIFCITSFFILIFIKVFDIKNKHISNIDNLILVKKGLNEKQLVNELNKLKIKISYIEWMIIKKIFNPKISIKYGEYFIPKHFTISELQKKLDSGKTFTRKFTLIEGWNAQILKDKLNMAFGLTGEVNSLKEGIYKPDTYNYSWGDTKFSLLKRMENEQNKVLNKYWVLRTKNKEIKSKFQALILASIIEKETNRNSESKIISSVFINRLKKNIKLQSDVTVAYGLNISGDKLVKKSLKIKNKFNTYLNFGLPPTPISYPSEISIEAAILPIDSDYLFFVADGEGGHRFSKTYKKHKENIKLWLKSKK